MELNFTEELLARMIGWEVIAYLKQENKLDSLAKEAQNEAVRAMEQIQKALNDDSLDDPACFDRIERIVEIFHAYGLSTSRHDFG